MERGKLINTQLGRSINSRWKTWIKKKNPKRGNLKVKSAGFSQVRRLRSVDTSSSALFYGFKEKRGEGNGSQMDVNAPFRHVKATKINKGKAKPHWSGGWYLLPQQEETAGYFPVDPSQRGSGSTRDYRNVRISISRPTALPTEADTLRQDCTLCQDKGNEKDALKKEKGRVNQRMWSILDASFEIHIR